MLPGTQLTNSMWVIATIVCEDPMGWPGSLSMNPPRPGLHAMCTDCNRERQQETHGKKHSNGFWTTSEVEYQPTNVFEPYKMNLPTSLNSSGFEYILERQPK
jgi:hypothetical protein